MKSYPTKIVTIIVLCFSMGGCATAQKEVSDGSDDCPDTSAVLEFAVSAYKQGENAAALAALEYVLDREPGNQEAEYYVELIQETQKAQVRRVQIIFPTIPPQVVTR